MKLEETVNLLNNNGQHFKCVLLSLMLIFIPSIKTLLLSPWELKSEKVCFLAVFFLPATTWTKKVRKILQSSLWPNESCSEGDKINSDSEHCRLGEQEVRGWQWTAIVGLTHNRYRKPWCVGLVYLHSLCHGLLIPADVHFELIIVLIIEQALNKSMGQESALAQVLSQALYDPPSIAWGSPWATKHHCGPGIP